MAGLNPENILRDDSQGGEGEEEEETKTITLMDDTDDEDDDDDEKEKSKKEGRRLTGRQEIVGAGESQKDLRMRVPFLTPPPPLLLLSTRHKEPIKV